MTEKMTRLMLVEDDPSIAEVAVMVLADIGGYEVVHFSGGAEALEGMSDAQPQLILMDVMMPGLDGPETMAELKNDDRYKDIPVVFLTAKAQLHEQKAYLQLGAAAVIVKPFDPMTLSEQVEQIWLESRV
jgi:CheY-like chemotaxis protein